MANAGLCLLLTLRRLFVKWFSLSLSSSHTSSSSSYLSSSSSYTIIVKRMSIEDFYVNDQEKSDVGKFEGNLWESSSFSKLHCMLHRIIVSLCSVYHCVSLYHCIFVSLYHYITVYHCITVSLYHCIFLKLQCIIVSLCSLCIIVSLYHCIFLKLHCIITLCFVHFVP